MTTSRHTYRIAGGAAAARSHGVTRAQLLRTAAATAAALAGGVLGACGPFQRAQPTTESSQVAEVAFMRPANQPLAEAYQAQAERFNQKQRRIRARFDTGASEDYGGDLFSDDFKRVRVTERPVVDAIQFVVDVVQRHGVTSGSPGASLGPTPTDNGKVAMWRGNRGGFGGLRSVTTFKFNVVPIANAPGRSFSTTVTTPGHIAIARNNKQPDAAWEWLKFLTGTEALIIRSEVAGGCPSRKSATQHPSYSDFTIPALATTEANKTFADVLTDPRTARFVPKYIAVNEAQGVLSKHVTAASRGEQSVPAALENARQELEALLREKPQPQG